LKSLLRQLDAAPELASVDLGLPPMTKRSYVEAALDIARGKLRQAATRLGIERTTRYSRQNHTPGMEEES
jgi:transcriptional regulator of acetoin/glycerol metabolism